MEIASAVGRFLTSLFTLAISPVQEQLVKLELLDRRECNYTLTRPDDFFAHCQMILLRAADLRSAPHLCDIQFLPSEDECREAYQHNWAYRRYIEARRAWEPQHWEFYGECLADTERLAEIWELATSARSEWHYIVSRRRNLAHLKELLGEEAYYAGRFPPAAPIWRFEER